MGAVAVVAREQISFKNKHIAVNLWNLFKRGFKNIVFLLLNNNNNNNNNNATKQLIIYQKQIKFLKYKFNEHVITNSKQHYMLI